MSVDVAELVRLRARHPQAVAEAAERRIRRPMLGDSGRLMIVAADHPARGALRLPTVRGLVAGRSLLHPADGDVAAAVDTAVGLL
ncbi:Cgl0159 family (beta/alpha)8-fold protein [Streptomyces nigra]|uniref:Cgl0159 family (beta/alpha)8-fold protein n=1 Tax=Streptomyces nigra TaxID=1827580 RepID=UPI003F4DB94F